MNFLYLSPEFPPNYANFILRLNDMGIHVYGIGEADFYYMPEPLRQALKWYVRADLGATDAVESALEQLLSVQIGHGFAPGFDLVESHNEQWLRLEGFINHKLGINGIQPQDLDRLKKKSVMKQIFKQAGLPVARGELVRGFSHGLRLASALGYPLILKPDEGVGACGIHKVADETQLRHLLAEIRGDYLLEEYIDARIVTYDGLVDAEGGICFENSLVYGDGVLEYVLGKDTFFYVRRDIPRKLKLVGRELTKRFGIRRKFFHFEFFVFNEDYMPIEINCRPPGGPILDMMNYSVDDDLYAAYARLIARGRTAVRKEKKYYCAYLGRRDHDYLLGHDAVLAAYGHCLVGFAENPPIFQGAMGKYRYIFRSASASEIRAIADAVLQKT